MSNYGFMTGAAIADGQARRNIRKWQEYSEGLQEQIRQVDQALKQEQVARIQNCSDIHALTKSIDALPDEIREIVKQSIRQNYCDAFVAHATKNGIPAEYAKEAAQCEASATLKNIR